MEEVLPTEKHGIHIDQDLTKIFGEMAARDAIVQDMEDKTNSLQMQTEADNARAIIRAFRDKEARLAETMLKHDGILHTVNRQKRELADTSKGDILERKHLSAIIEDLIRELEPLQEYIRTVHRSLSEEAATLGIQLNDIKVTLDF